MALAAGSRLGPYQILDAIGAGGMGEVYKARDTRLGRTVAIKVMPPHLVSDPDTRERFEREARTISQLSHPHICALYDVGKDDDVDYLVLEYLEGQTLADRLSFRALPLAEALTIAGDVAEALDNAHRRQIVHRDLKPGNIMLTKSGTKLLDFGLAKPMVPFLTTNGSTLALNSNRLTGQGTILGTLPYMAPEQVQGHEADVRTDIFAFGATVYEAITGRRAFEGQGATVIAAILERDPPPLASIQPQVPGLVARVIERCLEKDPDKRWQNMRDVAIALQLSGDPTTAARDSAARDARSRIAVVALAASGILLAAVGAWAGKQWMQGSAPGAPSALIRFVVDDPPVTGDLAGGVPSIAIAKDGSVFVYVTTDNGVRRLYQRRLGDPSSTLIKGTEGANNPFLSPDAQWVGFTVSSTTASQLRKVSLSGGDPVTICELGATRGAAWAADGTIVFAPNPEFGLWRVSADGGTPVPITQPDANTGARSHRWPVVLPDGRSVLYTVARSDITTFDDAVIAMRDLVTGEETELVRGGTFPIYVAETGHLVYTRAGTLLALPLDINRRTTNGSPVILQTNVVTYPATGGAAVAISDTGVLLALEGRPMSASEGSVVLLDRRGAATTIPFPPEALGPSTLAPDGRTIAIGVDGANSSIWIGDIRNATSVRITSSWTNIWPTWAPDGRRIAYASGRGDGHRVFLQAVDGRGQPEQLTSGVHHHSAPTSWSSDGRYIAYDDQVPPARRDVMVVDLVDGRRTFGVVQTPFDEFGGKFSPDMRYVAYISNESGNPEVYLQTFPEATSRTRVSRTGARSAPVWARNGRELYYISGDAMMAVTVNTSPELTLGQPRVLFRRALPNFFDVTPDGQFMIFDPPQTPLFAAPLQVTVNGLGLLRRSD